MALEIRLFIVFTYRVVLGVLEPSLLLLFKSRELKVS